ncbi:MAG TPA: PepSY-like domain-containing protein [Candidatus Parabacteroides intestinigallinarum]|uniref:PepSY-like domain-containing protein n=1 Tax=Candidatus Parabacteroides intestinigallinarum TaxID=2838722 RepID=A0A9D1XSE4_9BACT|nr:PepSY-like domain-containing protein [Candidatus Parabacteroides intestinigallinarum]
MRRLFMLWVCMCALGATTVWADSDKPIQYKDLPVAAQRFVERHFPGRKIALARMDAGFFDKSYDVIFVNGDKIEFDKKGDWKEMRSARGGVVPASAVPAAINTRVTRDYPGIYIMEIERDKNEYEVKLSNGRDLTFDKRFRLIDMD